MKQRRKIGVEKTWKQRRIKEVNKEGEEERKCRLEMREKWRKVKIWRKVMKCFEGLCRERLTVEYIRKIKLLCINN